jgi:hypothetical protein
MAAPAVEIAGEIGAWPAPFKKRYNLNTSLSSFWPAELIGHVPGEGLKEAMILQRSPAAGDETARTTYTAQFGVGNTKSVNNQPYKSGGAQSKSDGRADGLHFDKRAGMSGYEYVWVGINISPSVWTGATPGFKIGKFNADACWFGTVQKWGYFYFWYYECGDPQLHVWDSDSHRRK